MKKSKIEDLSIEDLLTYEKATSVVCKKYENSCKTYDGSITNREEYDTFLFFNKIHERVISAMQKRIQDNLE